MPDNTDDLERALNEAQAGITTAADTVEHVERRVASKNIARMGRDRSWISIAIIATCALTIVGAVIYLLVTASACDGADATVCSPRVASWEAQVARLQDLIVTAVLPIVTLMLGFYFGTETTRNSASNG